MVGGEDCSSQKWVRNGRIRRHASRLMSAGAYAGNLSWLIRVSPMEGPIFAGQLASFFLEWSQTSI